jgi:hypothetical protein
MVKSKSSTLKKNKKHLPQNEEKTLQQEIVYPSIQVCHVNQCSRKKSMNAVRLPVNHSYLTVINYQQVILVYVYLYTFRL